MPYIYGQLLNAQLENSVGNPASGGNPIGRIYIDITNPAEGILKYYNGSSYIPLSTPPATPMTLNNTATATFNATGLNETIYRTDASTLASLTINLPTVTSVGQIIRYATNGAVTAVTITGTIVVGVNPTAFMPGQTTVWQAIDIAGTFVIIT